MNINCGVIFSGLVIALTLPGCTSSEPASCTDSRTCSTGTFCSPRMRCEPVDAIADLSTSPETPDLGSPSLMNQPLGHAFSLRAGDTRNQRPDAVAVDSTGAVIFAGRFRQQIDIKGTILSAAGESWFLARLTPSGALNWAIAIGPVSTYMPEPTSAPVLAIDNKDNIYFTGRFDARDSSVDCGDGVNRAMSNGSFFNGNRILISQFKPDKTCVWARTVDLGGSNTGHITAMALDSANDLVVAGAMNSAFKFDATNLTVGGANDIFLAKLRANSGVEIWAERFGNTDEDQPLDLAIAAQDEIVLTGQVTGGVDLGMGALPSYGKKDLFLARYDRTGAPIWSHSFGSGGDDIGTSVAVDSSGLILLAATTEARIDFDPKQPGRVITTPLGLRDAVIAVLDGKGQASWALSLGGASDDSAVSVAADGRGSVLVTGNFSGNGSFGMIQAAAQQQDGFLTRHALADGQVLQLVSLMGASDEVITALAADKLGAAYVVGSTRSDVVDFGGGALNTYGTGSDDIFVLKMMPR